jgi:hypothetical protein
MKRLILIVLEMAFLVLVFSFVAGSFEWIYAHGQDHVATRFIYCCLMVFGVWMVIAGTDDTPTGEGR